MADAATLDIADDIGEPPEGKLAPAAVINKDDAHDETDEDDNTLPTREEANRRRRKLERERRLTERPQPGAQPLIVGFAHALTAAAHAVRHIPPEPPFVSTFAHSLSVTFSKTFHWSLRLIVPVLPANAKSNSRHSRLCIHN